MRGLPKDGNSLYLRPDIVTALEKGDIVCMQETFYSKQDLDILNHTPQFQWYWRIDYRLPRWASPGSPARGRGRYSLAEKTGSRNYAY